ncbi:MAG: recombinase family protein [Fibromonadales bacterium]|nr:recombinase family protein [Fibromonadales bacterium]
MTYGYIRVSTNKQDVENQKLGIEKRARELAVQIDEWVADDGVSGTKEYSKRNLGDLMEKVKDGDIIIVSEISRLARSVFMLFRIVEHCTQKIDATIHACKENQILRKGDVVSAIILSAYGTAAQIEREMIVKRTVEGLERRRQAGVILGRPPGVKNQSKLLEGKEEEVLDMVNKKIPFASIARLLGVHRMTLLNFCKERNIANPRWTGSFNKSPNYMRGIAAQELFDKNKDKIIEMLKTGLIPREISREFMELQKSKGLPEIPKYSFKNWLMKNDDVHNVWVEKNLESRAKYNVDCGKQKGYYRY